MKKNPLALALLISVIFLVVFLFTSLLWKRRFPYTGTWLYQVSSGAVIRRTVSFNSSGECSMDYSNKSWMMYHKNVPCSYSMSGEKANVYYEFKNVYDSNFSYPQALRAQYTAIITPTNNGRSLRMETLEAVVTRRQGDRIWQQKYTEFDPKFILLQKISNSDEK